MTFPTIRRYAAGTDFISYPSGSRTAPREDVVLTAADGVQSAAALYSEGNEKTVLCLMHPRADMTSHYAVPGLTTSGYAFFAQRGRSPGDDISALTIHEWLLADVAAGMRWLRDRGFENIILLGNSGAASLFSLYQKQALTAPPGRLTDTAAGDPYDLNGQEMPVADGFVYLGAHLGPGITMQGELDPSVVDENDPTSCDPFLDMYNPDNGFREPPETSKYSAEFLTRYRAAQAARAGRIDSLAWEMVKARRAAEAETRSNSFEQLEYAERAAVWRHAGAWRLMQVHRMSADPAAVDLSITPSDRTYGTLMGVRPDIANYTQMATKTLTPEVWLSSWSARYSRADLLANLDAVTVPTMVLSYTADNAIPPQVGERVYEASPAADKELSTVVGDHFGHPIASDSSADPRAEVVAGMTKWLQSRYESA